MTMPYLYKQNRYQWIAIIVIGFFLVSESQFRACTQSEIEDRFENRMKTLELKQLPAHVMSSSLFVPSKPKYKNHEHGRHNDPLEQRDAID